MSRYGDISYLMNMNAGNGLNLISEAFEQNKRNESYQMYLSQVPIMLLSGSEIVLFEDYYRGSVTEKPTKKVDKKDVYSKVENIMNDFKI